MNERRQDQIDKVESKGPKAEWTPPELCRFAAGAAEFGDVSSADAQPGFS